MSFQPDSNFEPTESDGSPLVHAFFDVPTSTWTYVVVDTATKEAFIIDSVLQVDMTSGKVTSESAERLASFVTEKQYTVVGIIETHVHADHASAANVLKRVRFSFPRVLLHAADASYRSYYQVMCQYTSGDKLVRCKRRSHLSTDTVGVI